MTDRQKRFADEYIHDCNATRAYKAAYSSVKKDSTAAQAGSRLLRNVNVSTYIKEKLDEISSQKTADGREVLEYLTRVLRGESDSSKTPEEKDRLKAAELLGKRYGLFKESVALGFEPVIIENDLKE
ncbi:MAG: terminase small subunit [Clostridia bacterium]|nr:terminase small subunit [Clostridia bacterium]